MTEADLVKLKTKIDAAKISAAELKGHLSALDKQFKEVWSVISKADAEKMLDKLIATRDKLNESIQTGLQELETEYNKIANNAQD